MNRPDFLSAASGALQFEPGDERRSAGRRGTNRGADARRMAIALATEAGYGPQDAAEAAGLKDRTSARYHLRKHGDLMETDPAYALAYGHARTAMREQGAGAGVAMYGRAFLPGEPHRIHALGSDGAACCGTPLGGARGADSLQVGPEDLIGRRALQGVLCIGPEEIRRFVTCARCLRSITNP